MNQKAIITGDLASSRKIDSRRREQLYSDLDSFLATLVPGLITRYETYRGDSLQCESKSVQTSLRAALMIRTYIMAYSAEGKTKKKTKTTKGYFNNEFDIRLSVGIGSVDFIKNNKISTSDGEAFRISGEALDSIKNENQKLIVQTNQTELNKELEALIILIDALAQKWTQNQAELIFHKLNEKKDDEIAAKLGISISAINQRKRTSQWSAIEKAVKYFEYKTGKAI
ncbi:MAG: SatD family protein [Flavitalea sp.]